MVVAKRSYVTKQIQEALALPTLKQQKILIKTFGSEQEQERVGDVVKMGLKTADGNAIELHLLSVPLICEPLFHQPHSTCKSTYKHLALLHFTNIEDERSELPVDMLIGSDHYSGKSLLARTRLCKEKAVLLPLKLTMDGFVRPHLWP